MLPTSSFGSESETQGMFAYVQSLIQQSTQGFSSYMSNLFGENSKLFLLAALAIPTWIFLESRRFQKTPEQKEKDELIDKIAAKYNIGFYPSHSPYHPYNLNTVAKFLSHEEWLDWKKYEQKNVIPQSYKAELQADIEGLKAENPHTIFKEFVWPILSEISLANPLPENPTEQDIEGYRQKNRKIWIDFMKLIRANTTTSEGVLLLHNNNDYFKVIQGYLSTILDKQTENLKKSIQCAIHKDSTLTASQQEPEAAYFSK